MKNEIILHSDSLRAACGGCSLDAHCGGCLNFQLLAILLRQLLADKLSCGTRRAAVTAQRKALCKQVQLVDIKVQVVLLGQLLDDVQILVLIRHGEGDRTSSP